MSYQTESLLSELRNTILMGTGNRVWNLAVEIESQEIVLRGFANTFHTKQLAQEAVRKKLPEMRLKNAITVLS